MIGIPPGGIQQPAAKADGWYAISALAASAYLVRCPGHATWCGEVESLDWSSNGRWLAISVTSYGSANPYNGIHVIDLVTGIDRQIRSCIPGVECDWFDLDWSPDGSRLAYVTEGRIWTIRRDGSDHRWLPTGSSGDASSPSWSPDGHWIAYALRPAPHETAAVFRARPDGSDRVVLIDGASEPAWSPDGRRIALASRCGGIKLITPTGHDVTPGVTACRKIGVSGLPVWSLDGERLAIVGHRGNTISSRPGVYLVDTTGRNLRLLTSRTNGSGVTGRADGSWQPRLQP